MTTVNANDNATMNAANDEDEPLTAPGTSPYPVDLRVAGEPAVVVGGGRVATRKVTHLLNAGAKVTVVSPNWTSRSPSVRRPAKSLGRPRTTRPAIWLTPAWSSPAPTTRP